MAPTHPPPCLAGNLGKTCNIQWWGGKVRDHGDAGRCQVTQDLVPMLRTLDLTHRHHMGKPPFPSYHWPRKPWTSNLEF